MKKVTTKSSGCAPQSSNCVQWDGEDIPALGIEKGDCLTDTMTIIANKVVQLAEPTDLSTLTLECIVEKFGTEEPAIRSIVNIMQILIDNDCTLYDMIIAVENQIANGGPPLQLDLKCLVTLDPYGNPEPYNERSVFQALINSACSQQTAIDNINLKTADLQDQIDDLNVTPYVEPSLTSCYYTNKPTSQALSLLAQAQCVRDGLIGPNNAISAAIAAQPVDFNTAYAAFPGWITNVLTAADMWNNMQIVMGDLFARVTEIENTCCAIGCESINVGMEVQVNEDNTRITLFYTEVMGTVIPAKWVDDGSFLIITDVKGRERKYVSLNVTQNGESPELDIAGFDLTDVLTLCLTAKFKNVDTGEVCTKCECRTYMVTDNSCPVCKVTATGTTGSVTIVYQDF